MIQENVLQRVVNFPQIVHDVIRCSDMTTLTWAPMKFRYPWDIIIGRVSRGQVAGDALHPMTPDLAQGGCAVLEDAVILGRHIGNYYIRNGRKLCNKNLETEIEMYVKERRWRVASLVSASYFSGWVEQGGSGEAGWFVSEFHDFLSEKKVHKPKGTCFLLYLIAVLSTWGCSSDGRALAYRRIDAPLLH